MIVAGSASPLLLSSAGGYNLTKSLRFRSSASAYLNRTFSTGNRLLFTFSAWVKRGSLTGNQNIFGPDTSTSGSGTYGVLRFVDGNLEAFDYTNGTINWYLATTPVYRDPSAWYHIVMAYDSAQATSSNRVKLYVNGVQITSFGTANYPTSSYQGQWNNNLTHYLGTAQIGGSNQYFDGYMAEVNFIDGQALTPSSFGETDPRTGVWIPKKYTGTYGTNGFYLPFTDVATTSGSNAGLGKDFSGNGNYWTTNNISVTTGTTYDSMSDVPTLTSATAANYCTLNPLDTNSNLALSNGNLTAIPSSTADYWLSRATMQLPSTGKWYWELTLNNTPYLYQAGIYSANRPNSGGTSATGNEYQVAWGTAWTYIMYQSNNAAFAAWGTNTNPTSGNVLMFAVDSDNGTMWVGRNGTWYNTSGTANPATNTDPRFSSIPSGLFAGVNLPNPASGGVSMNFGQQGFAYTPPSGFKALNTFNLPTPTIGATASTVANKYFDVNLWTGNGTSTGNTQVITNAGGFQPDFVWIKARNTSTPFHILNDSVRGTNKILYSNSTDAENSVSNVFNSFNSNGFTVAYNSSFQQTVTNENGQTYVGWQWKANGSGSTNTAGSITSTVSANTTAGFSVVTYTGTGSAATVGHGLGVAPSMIIVKRRDAGGSGWSVYFTTLPAGYVLSLQSTNGQANSSNRFTTTLPTSTVFSIGTDSDLNASGGTYVAYCFAQVAGYSAFGSYTGNGSTDGPFVFTGFRPKYILIKRTDTTASWYVYDTVRQNYNAMGAQTDPLLPNSSSAEGGPDASWYIDALSNGFKIRNASNFDNNSSGTYIYACFAESPFKYANAR